MPIENYINLVAPPFTRQKNLSVKINTENNREGKTSLVKDHARQNTKEWVKEKAIAITDKRTMPRTHRRLVCTAREGK